jgi:hypothetical protein
MKRKVDKDLVLPLPFTTFGDVAAAGLEISVTCRCRREILIDSAHESIRDRWLCDVRFSCTTVLPDGMRCVSRPHLSIEHAGSWAAQIARTPNQIFRP